MKSVRIIVTTSYDCEVPEDLDARGIIEWANGQGKLVPAEIADSYSEIFDENGEAIE